MDKNKLNRFRFDFLTEVVSIDEEKQTVLFRIIPDARRYEWIEYKGKPHLFDKLDRVILPEDFIKDVVAQLPNLPFYNEPPLMESAVQYVEDRIPSMRKELAGDFPSASFADKSEEFLEALKINELGFVILSLDMVNSTLLSTSLAPDKYSRLISVLMYEMSNIIPLFRGTRA